MNKIRLDPYLDGPPVDSTRCKSARLGRAGLPIVIICAVITFGLLYYLYEYYTH